MGRTRQQRLTGADDRRSNQQEEFCPDQAGVGHVRPPRGSVGSTVEGRVIVMMEAEVLEVCGGIACEDGSFVRVSEEGHYGGARRVR
jgi:hypothetical protein